MELYRLLIMGEPILLIVIPLAGAAAALAGKLAGLRRVFTVLALSSFAGMAGVLGFQYADGPGGEGAGAALYTLGGFEGEPGIAMVLSGSAWLASVLIVLIGALTAVFSLGRREFDLRYYFFLLMMTAGMETVVLTGDIFTMFVGLEVVALAAYVLIAWERSGEGLLASLKYLFLSSAAILFFLFGVFVVYRDFGSLSFEVIARRVGEWGEIGGGLGERPGLGLGRPGGRGWGKGRGRGGRAGRGGHRGGERGGDWFRGGRPVCGDRGAYRLHSVSHVAAGGSRLGASSHIGSAFGGADQDFVSRDVPYSRCIFGTAYRSDADVARRGYGDCGGGLGAGSE